MNRREFIRNATGISGAIMAPALAAGMEAQKVAASTTRVALVKTMDRAAGAVRAIDFNCNSRTATTLVSPTSASRRRAVRSCRDSVAQPVFRAL